MLQDIRDHTQGVIAKVIIGLIVAVFALWGVESIIGGFIRPPSVATVNGEPINEQQLAINTQNLLNSIGGNLEMFDQGLLEQVALNQLVEEELLKQAATAGKMQVSENRIDQAIIETSSFQIDGVFNSDLALRTMTSQGYSVPLYRDQLRNSILLAQLANAYSSSNFVTDDEIARIAELRLQSRDFRFASVPIGTRTLGVAIPDEEIKAYYDTHAEEFMIDETVALQYVLLDKQMIMDELEIAEDLVTSQYERERDAFVSATERRASHILFETGAAMSLDQAREQAIAAKQRLDNGEDFALLAAELSSDQSSAESGGDIGFSDGSAFPQAIEDALATMATGEVSGPVETEFGIHLVKLTENTEASFPPLDEVRDRILRDLKTADVERIFAERLESMSNMAFESSDLSVISNELELAIQNSESISRNSANGIFANPAVIEAAFSDDVLNGGHNSDVIELNDAQAMVLRLLEHRPASVRPLEEVQGEIAVILRTDMETARAAELGNQILQALQTGGSADELMQANELEWVVEQGVTRNSNVANPELIGAVFSLEKPESAQTPVYHGLSLSNGTYVVIELQAVAAGNIANLSIEERETITTQILEEKSRAEFNAFIAGLREQADITTNLAAADTL